MHTILPEAEEFLSLPDEQIKKIKQIVDTIAFKVVYDDFDLESGGSVLVKPIPYSHFPQNIEPFEINKVLGELASSFLIITDLDFRKDEVCFNFSEDFTKNDFDAFRNLVEEQYKVVLDREEKASKIHDPKVVLDDPTKNFQLESIILISESIVLKDNLWIVLNKEFQRPIRCSTKNVKGGDSYIKKLHNIAYPGNAPGKSVSYDRNVATSINNALFRLVGIREYMKKNSLKKPTLVQKSENEDLLVLAHETIVEVGTIDTKVPPQFKNLYIDKTK